MPYISHFSHVNRCAMRWLTVDAQVSSMPSILGLLRLTKRAGAVLTMSFVLETVAQSLAPAQNKGHASLRTEPPLPPVGPS